MRIWIVGNSTTIELLGCTNYTNRANPGTNKGLSKANLEISGLNLGEEGRWLRESTLNEGRISLLYIWILTVLLCLSDYLYRVDSYHVGTTGSAKSAWIASRSGQGGKTANELLGSTLTSKL